MSDDPLTRSRELWSLREDTVVRFPDSHSVVLQTRWGKLRLDGVTDTVREALRRMGYGPISLRNVVADYPRYDVADDHPWSGESRQLQTALDRLDGLVVRSLDIDGDEPLLSVIPVARRTLRPHPPRDSHPYRLSRFAMLRMVDGCLRLESPLSAYRVELYRPEAAWLVSHLARPNDVTTIGRLLAHSLPGPVVRDLLAYVTATGMVMAGHTDTVSGTTFHEDQDPTLAAWSPPELMVYTRLRLGTADLVRSDRWRDVRLPPEPAVKPPATSEGIALFRPDLDRLITTDAPLTTVMEARRSIRRYGASAPTLRQIGELLYRVARVRSLGHGPPGPAHGAQVSNRPYPSIAAAYPLELYLLVDRCVGLERGAYHYDPLGHALHRTPGRSDAVRTLLNEASATAELPGRPPVLIAMTVRIRRLRRNRAGTRRCGLLEEVGALQQSLYLVATAMGIAPCALAAADSDTAAAALGLDWLAEPIVGAFLLGSSDPAEEVTAVMDVPGNGHDWQERCIRELRHRSASDGRLG